MDFVEFLTRQGFTKPNEDYLWFDCESFDDGDSYLYLMEGLQRISCGRFTPEEITVKIGTPRKEGVLMKGDPLFDVNFQLTEILFCVDGRQELIKLCCDEWLDPDVVHHVNRILRECLSLSEQFYGVETGDQSLILVFGEPSLKKALEREGLWSDLDDLKIEKPANFSLLDIE